MHGHRIGYVRVNSFGQNPGHLTRRLFASMLGRIDRLALSSRQLLRRHPKKRLRYPPGMEMCLKKWLPDEPEKSAPGLSRGFGQPVYPPGDKSVLGCTQVGVYFSIAGRPKRKFRTRPA